MTTSTQPRTVAARMYDDDAGVIYEVAADAEGVYWRQGRAQWKRAHSFFNPTLDIYLSRCAENFGWRIERVESAS